VLLASFRVFEWICECVPAVPNQIITRTEAGASPVFHLDSVVGHVPKLVEVPDNEIFPELTCSMIIINHRISQPMEERDDESGGEFFSLFGGIVPQTLRDCHLQLP